MRVLERIALATSILNIAVFIGVWDIVVGWGVVTTALLTIIIYQKLKERKNEG